MKIRWHVALSCIAVAALASCAGVPKLVPPRATVNSVSVERVAAGEARFSVTLFIANPNDRDLAVDAIDATLTVEDVPIGSAVLAAPVRLPARGETSAILNARAGLDAIARIAAQIAQHANERPAEGAGAVVRYTVAGTATLENGMIIPFLRSGDFRLRGRRSEVQ
jgi:LEA14-like dessication related protein